MARCFLVTFCGKDFDVEVEDGENVRGFYTLRKVYADSEEEAIIVGKRELMNEEKTKWLVAESEERNCDWHIYVDEINELSLLGRWFKKVPSGFIFYKDDSDQQSNKAAYEIAGTGGAIDS